MEFSQGRKGKVMSSFYTEAELMEMGFKYIGKNVKISRKTSIYDISNISVDDNTRIDDFALLSGHIKIGKHVHIAAYAALFAGKAGIEVEDFCGLSARCNVYAASDDYSGQALTNPTVPEQYKLITSKKVIFKKHALIGAGCTVFPGVIVGEGASVGAMSLITKDVNPWMMYVGVPAKELRPREKALLQLEERLLEGEKNES